MAYRWKPVAGTFDQHELDSAGLVREFDSQESAERWLAEFYEDLSDLGVGEATLMEEDRVVYGPMSLLA